MHPQLSINRLSLLNNKTKSVHETEVTFSTSSASISSQPEQVTLTQAKIIFGTDSHDNDLSLNAQSFWLKAAKAIDWIQPPTIAYGPSSLAGGKDAWFPDGILNVCYEALDRHCLPSAHNRSAGDQPCIFHVSSMPEARKKPAETLTYTEVLTKVKTLAGVLRHRMNVKKGDTIVIYMAMVPECAIAMLACARIGAIHSVVFGGFAPRELAKRIDDAQPKALLASSCGIEPKGVVDYQPLVNSALKHAKHAPAAVLILRRLHIVSHHPQIASHSSSGGSRELDWEQECASLSGDLIVNECTPMSSTDPLYTLYTSGTTAQPKGVVRASGGYAVALRYSMEHVFGLKEGETMFTASDLGWVVGHSYILYAPLLRGCSTVIFEGKPIIPDAGIFWKIVEMHKCSAIFTAPTALRAVSRTDPHAELMRRYDLRSLRAIFLAGERSEPNIIIKYQKLLDELGAPGAIVNDNYWSTESGSPITAIAMSSAFSALKPRPGSAGLPLPGMDVRVVDDEGNEVPRGDMGNIVLAPPLAPSALATLWRNEQKFHDAYWARFAEHGKNWFDTGDAGMIDQDGYVHVLSRADDVMNVAGHRLSTSLLEQVISSHDLVAECCVVGRPDELKGHVPFALVALQLGTEAESVKADQLLKDVNKQIREDIGAIAGLGGLVIGRLPKTRSGKTLRRTIRGIVEACSHGDYDAKHTYPPTIEDPAVVEQAKQVIVRYFQVQRQTLNKSKL